MKTGKPLLLIDCPEKELSSFIENLRSHSLPFEVKAHIANGIRTGKLSELKRYCKYFGVAFMYFLRRNQCSVIIGWQQFYALILGFFCSVFSVKKSPRLIALNFTYKKKAGFFEKPYRWFMGKCINPQYMDYLHVPSQEYTEAIHREFGFPLNRIIVFPFGVHDRFDQLHGLAAPSGFQKEQYALAIGRSNRDYDFLIRAWKNIDFPLVIISDTYKKTAPSPNITIMNHIVGEESNAWIVNCGMMIIPIDDGSVCSGDTVLLTAMSLQRKIIVTTPSTLAEMYITNGEDALAVPKDESALQKAAADILSLEKYSDLGLHARERFLASYSLGSMGLNVAKILSTESK